MDFVDFVGSSGPHAEKLQAASCSSQLAPHIPLSFGQFLDKITLVTTLQGQLLSELDNYPLVCSSQCDEVEHDQANDHEERHGKGFRRDAMDQSLQRAGEGAHRLGDDLPGGVEVGERPTGFRGRDAAKTERADSSPG